MATVAARFGWLRSHQGDELVLSEAGLALLDELAGAELLQPQDRSLVESVIDVVRLATGAMAYAGIMDLDYAEVEKLIEAEEGDDG